MNKRVLFLFPLAALLCFSAAAQQGDFDIENRVLVAYHGSAADVRIPAGVIAIGDYAFVGNETLVSVTIPPGVTVISASAFGGCENLKQVTLPGSLTRIEDEAFAECAGLRSIIIPPGVTYIGWNAFEECKSLEYITFIGSKPPEIDAFIDRKIDIYVPAGAVNDYKNAEVWEEIAEWIRPLS
jgi:hypothetical protein